MGGGCLCKLIDLGPEEQTLMAPGVQSQRQTALPAQFTLSSRPSEEVLMAVDPCNVEAEGSVLHARDLQPWVPGPEA
jgi:hypothetical protein